ncbi:MAG: ATP-binding protein [Pseudohongiella sp.]|nr:ATP-binding protein [Pseudohongiella sp.]
MLDIEVEVLFEISLSVGGTLDLEAGAHEFLTKNVKLLNRMGGAVVQVSEENIHVLSSFPESFVDDITIHNFLNTSVQQSLSIPEQNASRRLSLHGRDVCCDFFTIPDFGVLVLCGKPLDLSKNFEGNFRHILKKFSAACHACILSADNMQKSRRLELATKSARLGTWELDIATGNIRIDHRIRELIGLTEDRFDYSLHEFFDYVHAEDKATVVAHVRNYIAQEVDEPTEYYFRINRSDGEVRKLASNAILLFDGAKATKLVGVNYDVTEEELALTQSMHRSRLENLLVSISFDLIKNQYDALDEVITAALCKAGEFVGADRAYRFSYDPDSQTTSNTHEWCAEGITPEIANLQNIPVDAIRLWITSHRAGLPFFVKSVQELPKGHALREILEPQGVKSLVTIPLMQNDNCVGFIGFDAVNHERLWTDVDLTLLKLLADLLVNADVKLNHELLIRSQNLALTEARDHAEKLAEEANQASLAKSRFVARVSHEIRTPLHAILGLADLVLAESPTPPIQQLTTTIRESGGVLLALINDVLDFSKAESNEVVLNVVEFKLSELLSSLESMFRPMAEKKNLQFRIITTLDQHSSYRGDKLRIRQIMTNLLSNAIKFTSGGSITVCVSAHYDTEQRLRFEVSDTGMGIPQQDLHKLFQPFFQSSNTDSLMLSGTGLGLTISTALAERMNGHIYVESEQGKGSRFTFEVPLLQLSSANVLDHPQSGRIAGGSLKEIRVLVAEDNPVNTQLIKAFLKSVTRNLVCVSDGQQAYEAMLDETAGFDVILMDCNMPVMDGFEASRAIRAAEKGRRRTPIIAVTAGAMEGDKAECLAAGMDDVLAKPFGKNDLLEILQLWVGQRSNTTKL